MSNNDMTIGILIKSGTEGTEKIIDLTQAINAAGVEANHLSDEGKELAKTFGEIERQQGLIDHFRDLEKQLEKTGQELDELANKNERVGEGAGGNYTQQQQRLEKLTKQQTALNKELDETVTAMNAAGIATDKLTASEDKLAKKAQKATVQLDRLSNEAKELKAIGDARIQLGIVDQDKINKELAETTKAYKLLKNSGTMSSTELANANQLHAKKVMELEQQLKGLKPTLSDVRGELTKFAGAGAAFTLIAREAMQFETAMAGVKKTVEASDEQMEALGRRIKELSVETAQSAEDVATIAALGGQLGVAYNELEGFVELASKIGVAFNLSAEQAGESVAKLSNIYQIPINEIESLMDAINTLGNNTAATEAQVVQSMQSIGGQARLFGLAAEEAAALANALIALGRPPEVAATAINAMLRELNSANTQSKAFKDALGQMGISANELAENIRNNPQQALTELLAKISELDSQAQTDVLSKLFQKEHAGTIALLTGSLDTYKKALELVNDETKKAGALNDEFNAQINTKENQIKQAQAAVSSLASTLGSALLPAIEATAGGVTDIASAVNEFAETHPVVTQLAVSFAALKVGMLGFGTATKLVGAAMPLLNAGLATTATSAAAATTGLTAATTATKGYATALGFLGKAMRLVTATPLALALMSAVAAIDLLIPKTEAWEESTRKAHDALTDLQNKAADGITLNLDENALKPVTDAIAEIDAEIESLAESGTGVVDFAADLLPLWDSNAEKMVELSNAKAELIARQRELIQSQKDAAAAEQEAAEKARIYAAEQEAARKRSLELMQKRKAELEKLGDTESDYYHYVTGAVNELNKTLNETPTKTREAFEALGLSMNQLITGITDSEKQAIDSFGVVSSEIDKIGVSAKKAGEMTEKALIATMSKITTPEGAKALLKTLNDIKKQTQAAFDAKAIKADEYKTRMEQINGMIKTTKDKLNELTPAWKELGDAIKKATDHQQLQQFADQAKKAFDEGKLSAEQYKQRLEEINKAKRDLLINNQKAAESDKKATDAAKEKTEATKAETTAQKENAKATKESAEASEKAAEATEKHRKVTHKLYDATALTAEQMAHMVTLTNEYVEASNNIGRNDTSGLARDIRETAKAMRQANEQMTELDKKISDGTVTTADLRYEFDLARDAMARLDEVTLSKMEATIKRAEQKIKDLVATAQGKVDELEAELARINGDDSLSRELEQKKKLAELEKKLAEARARNSAEEIAAYEKAIQYQKQIFEAEQKKYEAEKQRENERKRNQNNDGNRQDNNSGGGSISADNIGKDIGDALTKMPLPHVRIDTATIGRTLAEVISARDKALSKQVEDNLTRQIRQVVKGRGY